MHAAATSVVGSQYGRGRAVKRFGVLLNLASVSQNKGMQIKCHIGFLENFGKQMALIQYRWMIEVE
ncbi:hypothetical protein [Aquabacterium sp.]|uniref:hypothetical protein n=1 Tax=Aquabacterium sp. TaxID=1872578 RepID=UPI0025C51B5B|nr:hypothetical protein [Aquabacterium sp.]